MRQFSIPTAPGLYNRQEEQVFRDHIRRAVTDAFNMASAISENLRFGNLPEYADDTAAGTGGLIQGQFYRTATGVLMVKL